MSRVRSNASRDSRGKLLSRCFLSALGTTSESLPCAVKRLLFNENRIVPPYPLSLNEGSVSNDGTRVFFVITFVMWLRSLEIFSNNR